MKSRVTLFILLQLLLFPGCREKKGVEYMTTEKAAQYFNEVKAICDLDDGRLWGENLTDPSCWLMLRPGEYSPMCRMKRDC
ncbi:MAG: hypothetical protein R2727_07400 [Bacteroidales bacterium]